MAFGVLLCKTTRMRTLLCSVSALLLPWLIVPVRAHAAALPNPHVLCETAITSAEYGGRLPTRLLHAIAQVESGRFDEMTNAIRPWPWTINAEGAGAYFATKNDAIAAVKTLQARGVRSVDVGCMQVNLMFHPDAFASLDEAFDPRANARYAARFLNQLHAPGDSWLHAIAAYHSDTPLLGEPYRALVMLRWQNPTIVPDQTISVAYRSFLPLNTVYGAFVATSQVYRASAIPLPPSTARR